jgi:CBS domain-containing protein
MTPALDHVHVGDVMHHGILSCVGDVPLGEVAGIMAKHHVNAVAVTNGESSRPVGVVSDLDVIATAASGEEASTLQAAVTEPVGVSADESLHPGPRAQLWIGVCARRGRRRGDRQGHA